MVKELEGITPPEDKAILWRYMSLEKFANILATKSLFFTRADKFEDTLEGHVPRQIMSIYRSSVSSYEEKHFSKLSQSPILKNVRDLRKYVMCSCWHQENMSQWRCGTNITSVIVVLLSNNSRDLETVYRTNLMYLLVNAVP